MPPKTEVIDLTGGDDDDDLGRSEAEGGSPAPEDDDFVEVPRQDTIALSYSHRVQLVKKIWRENLLYYVEPLPRKPGGIIEPPLSDNPHHISHYIDPQLLEAKGIGQVPLHIRYPERQINYVQFGSLRTTIDHNDAQVCAEAMIIPWLTSGPLSREKFMDIVDMDHSWETQYPITFKWAFDRVQEKLEERYTLMAEQLGLAILLYLIDSEQWYKADFDNSSERLQFFQQELEKNPLLLVLFVHKIIGRVIPVEVVYVDHQKALYLYDEQTQELRTEKCREFFSIWHFFYCRLVNLIEAIYLARLNINIKGHEQLGNHKQWIRGRFFEIFCSAFETLTYIPDTDSWPVYSSIQMTGTRVPWDTPSAEDLGVEVGLEAGPPSPRNHKRPRVEDDVDAERLERRGRGNKRYRRNSSSYQPFFV